MSDFDGLITQSFKDLFTDAIDHLLASSSLTVPCKLIYEGTKFTNCPNCLIDPMTGKSSGQYQAGGPISFNTGICPYCKGLGKIPSQSTSIIYMGVIWDSKQFLGKISNNLNNLNQLVQTIGKLSQFDDLKKARQFIIDTDISDYTKNRFERANEPEFAGLGADSYIFTLWQRVA